MAARGTLLLFLSTLSLTGLAIQATPTKGLQIPSATRPTAKRSESDIISRLHDPALPHTDRISLIAKLGELSPSRAVIRELINNINWLDSRLDPRFDNDNDVWGLNISEIVSPDPKHAPAYKALVRIGRPAVKELVHEYIAFCFADRVSEWPHRHGYLIRDQNGTPIEKQMAHFRLVCVIVTLSVTDEMALSAINYLERYSALQPPTSQARRACESLIREIRQREHQWRRVLITN